MEEESNTISFIYRAIDEVNQFLPTEEHLMKNPETVLSARFDQGSLDSLGMVNFIVALEQVIDEELGVSISLADDLIISDEKNPFQTIAVLADNVNTLLNESKTV